jgi:hypothetical protein
LTTAIVLSAALLQNYLVDADYGNIGVQKPVCKYLRTLWIPLPVHLDNRQQH